jgi:hypothetical protein
MQAMTDKLITALSVISFSILFACAIVGMVTG